MWSPPRSRWPIRPRPFLIVRPHPASSPWSDNRDPNSRSSTRRRWAALSPYPPCADGPPRFPMAIAMLMGRPTSLRRRLRTGGQPTQSDAPTAAARFVDTSPLGMADWYFRRSDTCCGGRFSRVFVTHVGVLGRRAPALQSTALRRRAGSTPGDQPGSEVRRCRGLAAFSGCFAGYATRFLRRAA